MPSRLRTGDLRTHELIALLSSGNRAEEKNKNSQQDGPGQASHDLPGHDAHRLDPPRGGDRE